MRAVAFMGAPSRAKKMAAVISGAWGRYVSTLDANFTFVYSCLFTAVQIPSAQGLFSTPDLQSV